MNELLKKLINLIIISFLVLSCSKTSENIKVGIILPMTGAGGVYGKALKKGIELARSQAKEQKSINFDLIYEDDQSIPSGAVNSCNKLITINRARIIIGGAMSSSAEAIIPITEKNNVFLLSPTATKSDLIKGTKYFFRIWPSDNYDGQIMAKVAFDSLKLRKVAVLFINLAYGEGIANVFKSYFEKDGGNIVYYEGYKQNQTDFRSELLKIKNSGAEALYLPGYVTEVTQIMRQIKEMNFKLQILGVNSLYDPNLLKTAGSAAEGAIFTYPTYSPVSKKQVTKQFVKDFKQKYNEEPDVFAAQGYDALRIITVAVEDIQKVTPETIKQKILEIKTFEGAGGTITFRSNGNCEKELKLMTIKDGEFINYGM